MSNPVHQEFWSQAIGNWTAAHLRKSVHADGTIHVNVDGLPTIANALSIMVAATLKDGSGYSPAESVTIVGDGIVRLRDFLNQHYPPQAANPDFIAWLRDQPRVRVSIQYRPALDMPAVEIHEAIRDINHLGKTFYDRGFAVETIEGCTLIIDHKHPEAK
jgi:hypothetical protein